MPKMRNLSAKLTAFGIFAQNENFSVKDQYFHDFCPLIEIFQLNTLSSECLPRKINFSAEHPLFGIFPKMKNFPIRPVLS